MNNSAAARNTTPQRSLRIAIADDVPEIRAIARECLLLAGHHVQTAADGVELRKLAEHTSFDLVLTDIMMPESDGFEVISELKKRNPKIRIIAMSGGGKTMNGADCLRVAKTLGADAILPKPFSIEQLIGTVDAVCRRSRPAAQRSHV